MKRLFKTIILGVMGLCHHLFEVLGRKRRGIAVLMYHSVSDADWTFAISPTRFEQHLCYLRDKGYVFLSAIEAAAIIAGRRELPEKSVLITFDDGYQDFADTALPILERYQAPSAVFVHTDRSSQELGNDFPLMDWETISGAARRGVVIGNHSHSHPSLKRLSPQELATELTTAEALLADRLGSKPAVFAYPGGKLNVAVADELYRRGYALAFTVDEGLAYPGQDRMRIPRIGITRDLSFWEFKIKLTRVADWYAAFRKLR